MAEWQPIATAPMDGTRILGWFPKTRGICLLRRHDPGGAARNPKHNYECWVRDDNTPPEMSWQQPTMWQPLPHPPSE